MTSGLRGFTLAETLIASAIAMVIGLILVNMLINYTGVFYKQNALIAEGTSLNDTVAVLNNQIRQAVAVAAGYPEGAPVILSDNTHLVLKLPALSSAGIISETYDYVIFSKDAVKNNILKMEVYPDPSSSRPAGSQVLTSLLQTVQFNYLDRNNNPVTAGTASLVEVNLTVLAKTGSIGSSRTVKTVVDLRNH